MKKQTLFLLALVVFFSCQKIQVKEDTNINEKINQVRQTTTFLETQNGYDVYQDASGQKILIPTMQKTGCDGSVLVTSCEKCDQQLFYSNSTTSWVCTGIGRSCKWIVYNGSPQILVCNGPQY